MIYKSNKINKLIDTIIKKYPKDNNFTYDISQKKTERDIIEFLKKEFNESKFTLSKELIYSFIDNNDSTHFKINAHNITLNCIGPLNDIPPLLFLLRIIKRVICITQQFNIDKQFTIWLLPIKENRYFPSYGNAVEPVNINGGYTYANGTTIFIYRFEECAKVLLHEILHHSPYDTYNQWTNEQIIKMKNIFNIHETMIFNINEAIVEFWATIYQLVFISYEYHIPFKMLLKKEQEWSKLQSSKLIEYQQKYFTNKNNKWFENTNSYCYIIIKAILLVNYAEFIKISLPYSSEILCNFIETHYKNTYILNKQNNELHNKNKSNKLENSSMRMTLFGDI